MGISGSKLIAECSAYDFKVKLESKEPESWVKSVSAFANGNGGSLFYGVSDDGVVVGIDDPKGVARDISQIIKDHLDPIPVFAIIPIEGKDGKVVLEVKVSSGNQTPYYFVWKRRRLAFVRMGDESVPATSHQLYNLVLKGSNRSWDSLETTELRKDHSFTILAREYNERSGAKWEERLLTSFGLVTDDGYMTNAGLLFADNCPIKQSRVYCTRWDGIEKGDTINDAEFQGNLLMLLRQAKGFIKANTAVPWFKLPDYRLNLPEYSERAIEEKCVNHLIHRDYTELGAEVAINIYDDRIETTSPGGIKDTQGFEPVIPAETSSKRRNPVIAEVFSQLDYMEKRGSGLKKIVDATSLLPTYKMDRMPYFRSNRDEFRTVIPNVNYGMDRAALEAFAESKIPALQSRPEDEIITRENRPEKKIPAQRKIGKTAQSIIDILVSNPNATRSQLCSMLGKADGTIKEHLANLQARGIIERVGSDFGGHWKVLVRK